MVRRTNSEDVIDYVKLEHSGGEEHYDDTEEAFNYVK